MTAEELNGHYQPGMSSFRRYLSDDPSAFEQGYQARRDGGRRLDNPYDVLTDEHEDWERGFDSGIGPLFEDDDWDDDEEDGEWGDDGWGDADTGLAERWP